MSPSYAHATTRYRWLDETIMLVGILAVIVASMLLSPGYDGVSVGGQDLPPLCVWRQLTGHRCPGCGMTRSFVFMGHGRVFDAFRLHPLGPFLYALVVQQFVVRGWEWGWELRGHLRARRALSGPPAPDE